MMLKQSQTQIPFEAFTNFERVPNASPLLLVVLVNRQPQLMLLWLVIEYIMFGLLKTGI